ncbi:MAG: hypothetical protein D6786_03955, partial [Gammaproteobacteria bacterium]
MSRWLEPVLELHLDSEWGSPYWLQRQRELGIDLRREVRTVDDLALLGPFDLELLRRHPLEHFVPRAMLQGGRQMLLGETGGTSGPPCSVVFLEAEFEAAFVHPFFHATGWRRESEEGRWLWLGPGGPHLIGRAARRIARESTGCDCFSIDFDPRWYRTLAPGTLMRRRYLGHLLEQARRILHQQPSVRFLFATPVVLLELASGLEEQVRERIGFIYLGGMPVEPQPLQALGEYFPNARLLSGYGNSLFGVCHEAAPHRPDGEPPRYFPPDDGRMLLQLVSLDPALDDAERLILPVAEGECGQVVMHRLDCSLFLPNVMERDQGVRVRAGGREGVEAPQPLQVMGIEIEQGIY